MVGPFTLQIEDRQMTEDKVIRRLREAYEACHNIPEDRGATMEVRKDGIRIYLMDTGPNSYRGNIKMVGWLDIKLSKVNPLTQALDEALRELAA